MMGLQARDLKGFWGVLRQPIVTEKSTSLQETGTFSFLVPVKANKDLVRRAVEKIFSVRVVSVNSSLLKGKVKNFKGIQGRCQDRKKVFVKVDDKEKILSFLRGLEA